MILHLHLHYKTQFGQQIAIQYQTEQSTTERTLLFQTYDGENWTANMELKKSEIVRYNYIVIENTNVLDKEWGKKRSFSAPSSGRNVFIQDKWRTRKNERNVFFSSAFTNAIFKRNISTETQPKTDKITKGNKVVFQLHDANIEPNKKYCVIGNTAELGKWEVPLIMDDSNFPLWSTSINIESSNIHLEYKYALVDEQNQHVENWEEGENRICHFVVPEENNNELILADEQFRSPSGLWRGAGIAIPVFSLRSAQSMGIGEFSDLIPLVDWAATTGMNIVQVLPINDTIAKKTWEDSYPYAAISVFALHPLYINIQKIAKFKNKADNDVLQESIKMLNALEVIDFEKVLHTKFEFLNKLFIQEKFTFFKDKNVSHYIEKNADWLKPYAAFCYLRDKNGSCVYTHWPEYNVFSQDVIDKLCNPDFPEYDKITFYYFIQYHADRQLMEAKEYARAHGIALKGDLPIGIFRYSCDAWVAPHLYNMDEQAGAPPDDYAVQGQNWGFPTYNWEEMSKNGFEWWQERMRKLSEYFDALRIDHILGFFRIWQIPESQVFGTMGIFNPRLPYSVNELQAYGITGNPERYTTPFITDQNIKDLFGKDAKELKKIFFEDTKSGLYQFRQEFQTQKDISNFLKAQSKYVKYEAELQKLMTEVLLLIEPGSGEKFFNPRITISTTESFKNLDHFAQTRITNLYNEYFFNRHEQFWRKQALWKLPALLDASDMLICGEDLGMIPASVPGVMKELNIISLEIQRMPKSSHRFGKVSAYPYFSVCSPSCHDMSTIRGWWESDHEMAKEFYYNYLGWYGLTPMECTPEIVQSIIEDHLASPSMMAIFPIQDILGMDSSLRRNDAKAEQINEPSNPKHYWRYRFHLDMEDLLKETAFNNKVKTLIKKFGRINNPE